MIPFWCRYSNPFKICLVYTRMTASGNGPNFDSNEAMLPPGTYSKKMCSALSVRSVPK